MSAPPDTAGVRTPPLKSLIFKDSGFALSKIYQCSVFRSIEDASRGTPGGGSPTLRAAPPPPPKAPQRGVGRSPKGRGRAAPLSGRWPPLRPPWGTPTGFPRPFWPAPPPVRSGSEGGKRSAQGVSPEKGLEKIKVAAPIAAAGRQRWKCGEGEEVGGQGWGQPVGSPRGCPRGVPASVHGPAKPLAGRAAISTSPPPGGPTRPPLGGWTESRSRFPQH